MQGESIRPEHGEAEVRDRDVHADHAPVPAPPPSHAACGPKLWRRDVYPHPVVDGRVRREGALRTIVSGIRGMFVSQRALKEARLESQLAVPAALTRTNVVAVISPKGASGRRPSRAGDT